MKAKDLWSPPDPLGEALHLMRMSGTFYCRSELSEPWAMEMPALEDCLMFHVMTTGRGWLEVEGAESRLLQPGDFALVPHGDGHRLTSQPGLPAPRLLDLPRELISERYEVLRHGGGGSTATLICGVVRFEHPAARRLIELLPNVMSVDASAPQMEWMQSALRLMGTEARALLPGGEPVMRYLSRWRMQLALTQLREDDTTLSGLASKLGYQSEAAFARAFKRTLGVSPGRYRARARHGRLHA